MPTKYVLSIISGDHQNAELTRLLIAIITKLERLNDNRLEAQNNVGVDFYGVSKKILRKSSNLEIMSYGFLREEKKIWSNSRKDGLVHLGYSIAYPIILFFLFLLTI